MLPARPLAPARRLALRQQQFPAPSTTPFRTPSLQRAFADKSPAGYHHKLEHPKGDYVLETPKVDRPARPPQKDGPFLPVFFALLLAAPPVTYYYWQHRKEHMRAKKEAMLKEIQARASAQA